MGTGLRPDEILLTVLRLGLALSLYGFLAVAFYFLWRDLRRMGRGEVYPHPEGRLVVVEAGERGPEVGTVFPLQEVTSLGRSPGNTVVLPDPFASAHHALLSWREGHWWLEDQGSTNGTTLNGERIHRPTVVSAGDLIGIGKVVLRVEIGPG